MRRVTLLIVLAAVVLLGGCSAVAAPVLTAKPVIMANLPAAKASKVPPAPAGWTTVFSDGFAGKAGSAPSSANWLYDIGTGWGSNNADHDTNSTKNIYVDGHGHLVIQSTHTGGK